MNPRVRAALALLPLLAPVAACAEHEQSAASCQFAPTIAFDGREYIAVHSLPRGLGHGKVRVGELLGQGEAAHCPGQPERQVKVYKVVGEPVARAVISRPEFGLMGRWNRDGIIK